MFAILARLFGRRPARPAAPPPYPPLIAWDDWTCPPDRPFAEVLAKGGHTSTGLAAA